MNDMLVDTKKDMLTFINVFISCQIICILFDFLRALRQKRKVKVTLLAIEDSLFCLVAFYIFFKTLYLSNNFELRLYEFVSLFISVCIYFLYESKYVIIFLSKVATFIINIFSKTGLVLKKILNWFSKLMKFFTKKPKKGSKSHFFKKKS